jgi:trehalose synthase
VIATPVGGITIQVEHGRNGFLVPGTEEAAQLTVRLLRDSTMAAAIGAEARRTVRERFLLPRLVRDELRSYSEAVGAGVGARAA